MALNASKTSFKIRIEHPLPSSYYVFLSAILAYLLLAAFLRKHRVRTTLQNFPYTNRKSFASMTLGDAFYIQQNLAEMEFPMMFHKALQFALFRTYGIPTISKLLVQTSELSGPTTAAKRYVDTEVLVSEFYGYHPQSERATEAIARMNYIHSAYRKAGKISNEDMLYTLSLFALEPMRWVNRYEWRQLEDFEKNALGVFGKALGDAMDIEYGAHLKNAEEGWVDGLQWLEEVETWAEEYEKSYMVPAIDNFKTAEQTVALLLWYVPTWAKGFGKKLVYALMDDRLRIAMMYPRPPHLHYNLVSVLCGIRKFVLRYMILPRPGFLRKHNTAYLPNEENGRYNLQIMDAAPFYVKPTLPSRYGPSAWLTRLMGLPLPGDDGDKYWPQGYKIEDIGPKSMRGKGGSYARESKENLIKMRMSGCPFVRIKAE